VGRERGPGAEPAPKAFWGIVPLLVHTPNPQRAGKAGAEIASLDSEEKVVYLL